MANNKGQMRVIETILASFIIVAVLSFVSIFAVSPASPGYEMTDLEKMGLSALHDLDQQGILATLVYGQRWSDLRSILRITMPNDVYFNMTVYRFDDANHAVLIGDPNTPILYGDSNTFSDARNIASLTYCLVGVTEVGSSGRPINANYDARILVLRLTRG